MESTPSTVYEKIIDQQRILVTGNHRVRIVEFIAHLLSTNHRSFNHFGTGVFTPMASAPVTLIESEVGLDGINYNAHVIVISPSENALTELATLLDKTPKSGIIIYPESDSMVKALVAKERADVQALPYKQIAHDVKEGKVILISSSNEKFPIKLSSAADLLLLSAAKELVRKIGISSGQFYRAASTIE